MDKIGFMAPTPEQHTLAVLSSILTPQNVTIIIGTFIASFALLSLGKLGKSSISRIIISVVLAALAALYLYYQTYNQIRF